jgi:hypothetical protein
VYVREVPVRPHNVAFLLSDAELTALDKLVREDQSNRSNVLRGILCDAAGIKLVQGDVEPVVRLDTKTDMRRDWQRGRHSSYSLAVKFGVSQSSAARRIRAWRQREGSNG